MKKNCKIQLFVLILACGSRLVIGTFSLEDKVQLLTENYIATKDIFEAKLIQCEAKIIHLETKITQQELKINALQKEQAREHDVSVIISAEAKNSTLEKSFIPRTCQEAYDDDSTLKSGWYTIDPDGQNVGGESEIPIKVYCDMTVGSAVKTSITHDSELNIEVDNCMEAGCYNRDIHYSASNKQIAALAELSNECHQYFKYECIKAPFEYQNQQVSWWDDRNGNQQFFWAGKYTSPNAHTCDCGIYDTCVGGVKKKCNCDSGLSDYQSDDGIISDKIRLPIKRLNFGHSHDGSGQHTLGRFECSGKVFISGMPKSCADLRGFGRTLNGMYLVMGINSIENVFCDFSKLQNEQDFQKLTGKIGVQSSPTIFYVQRTSGMRSGIITFHDEQVNTGKEMNLSKGKFTAPVVGIYFFSFSGIGSMGSSLKDGKLQVSLVKNYQRIGKGEAQLTQGLSSDALTLQSTVHLQSGDQIWVEIDHNEEMELFDDWSHYTHFTGWLLEEDIVKTLNNVN